MDSSGCCFSYRLEIENVFTDHFHNLWTEPTSTNFLEIFQALPNDLPKIFDNKGFFLTQDITKIFVH